MRGLMRTRLASCPFGGLHLDIVQYSQVDKAIAEIYRLLKPNGKFFFIEHGLSRDDSILWQNRLTPVQKITLEIDEIVKRQFANVTIEQFYAPKLPKVIGYMYIAIGDEL